MTFFGKPVIPFCPKVTGLVFLAVLALWPQVGLGQGQTLVAADGSVDWNRYYTADETGQILREFHDLYPGLTELYSIGESLSGRPLWVMEVTAEQTGPAGEKSALYLDGGIHAGCPLCGRKRQADRRRSGW